MPTFSPLYSIPYIIFFLLLYVNVVPLYKTNTDFSFNNKYTIWLQHFFVAVLLIIFIGFRGFLYTDWINYYRVYETTPSLFDGAYSINKFFERSWEKGFLFYMIICKTIFPNYFFLQLISFIIDCIILYSFFKRIIPNYIVLGFIFYILFAGINIEFNLLRNSKAIMLFLISLKSLEERRFLKYIIINSIGVLFHITALLYFPLYFILNRKISRTVILFLFIVGNILFLLQIEWCKLLLTSISTMIPGRLGTLLKVYLSSDLYSKAYGITIGYIERFFTFIVIYYLFDKLCKINKYNLIYINAFFIYCFIFLYFSEMTILLERVAILFVFSYWILYPQLYSLIKNKNKKIFLVILLLYGVLKMSGNRNVLMLYDNIMFSHRSYHERKIILERNIKNIYE